jgi:hypothetical protein
MTGEVVTVTAAAGQIAWSLTQLLGTWAVGSFVGAGGGVLIAKTYLTQKIKSAIKAEYDEKLANLNAQLKIRNDAAIEVLKAQLKSESDISIEKLKSELSVAAAQRTLQFSQLHSQRAEVIAEVYHDLRDAIDCMVDYTKLFEPVGGTPRKERAKAAVEAVNKFIRIFRTKEIYIPQAAAEKLRMIADELKLAFFNFTYDVEPDQMREFEHGPKVSEKWKEIQQRAENLSGPALEELENEFRGLLGYPMAIGTVLTEKSEIQ